MHRTISLSFVVLVTLAAHHVYAADGGEKGIARAASIHGTKWLDANGDGARDRDEPGLPGVTIYLDLNNNSQLDRGEPRAVTMRDDPDTDFDEAGLYWIEDVEPGRYLVREVVPDGFRQTFPVDLAGGGGGGFSEVTPEAIALELDDGESADVDVAISILPLCIRPYEITVVAPAASTGIFSNVTGTITNACGGDTSKFTVRLTGDGSSHSFSLQFVDKDFGEVLGQIPVRIGGAASSAAPSRVGTCR